MKLPTLLLSSVLVATSLPLTSFAQSSAATAAATPTPAPHDQFSLPETDEGLPGTGPIRRYDWFKNLWHSQRSSWAERVQKEQNSIVFVGDSITQGWGDVGSYFPGIKTANRGISGDTTRGVLIRMQDVFDLHPRGIVLLIGTNDLDEKAEPETIASNLKLILEAIRNNNPNTPVVLCYV
ncbi:MAG TPA: GDSL-type esterase/lipase family protein, partial [Opitutaceae bacterium]